MNFRPESIEFGTLQRGCGMPLISMHIPKTAGTSFRHALNTVFGSALALDYSNEGIEPLTPSNIAADVACIHGHFPPSKYLAHFPTATWITWLRDPAQRLQSAYYQYVRFFNPKDAFSTRYFSGLPGQTISFEDFVVHERFRNLQSRMLGPLGFEGFAFVGICELFDDSMKVFADTLDIRFAPQIERHNKNPNKAGSVYLLDEGLHQLIREFHARDYQLYQLAWQRLKVAKQAARMECGFNSDVQS